MSSSQANTDVGFERKTCVESQSAASETRARTDQPSAREPAEQPSAVPEAASDRPLCTARVEESRAALSADVRSCLVDTLADILAAAHQERFGERSVLEATPG